MGYWEYSYDAIGNLITQTDARNVTSTIAYDLANRNTGKSFSSQSGVSTTAAITNDYDGTSILEPFSGSSLPGIFATSGSPNLSVTGGVMIFTGNGTWDSVRRTVTSILDGKSVSFVFKKTSNTGQTNAFIDTGTYGQANYRRYSFEILNGNFQRSTYTGTTVNTTSLMAFNPNTWYMGMLTVGQSGKFQVKIWERDNPAVMAVYNDSFDSSWQNLNWTLRIQNTQAELQIDNYRELDRMGYRSSMTDGSGTTSWLYDNRGKVVKEIKTISGQGSFMTQWGYNSAGLLVSMTYPGGNSGLAGEVLNYTYNKRMLLETMSGNSNYITDSQYDSAGRLVERILSNGTLKIVRNYYDWDSYGGRLSTIQSGTVSTPTSIQNLTYSEYDNNGNIKRFANPYEKNLGGTQVSAKTYYNYDELNRLVDAQMKNPDGSFTYYQQSYGYDELGRLETKAGTTLAYDEPNDKLHAVSSAGTIDYLYDANGNMTLRDTGTALTTFNFTYDSENRLVLAASSTTTVTFTYDGDGNRVKTIQTVSGITTTTNLIGRNYEWVSSSNQKRYYYAGSDRIALGTSTNLITYIFSDHLGSTVAIRNPLGSIYRTGYYPFGEERFVNNSTPYQFTGQRKEAAIGLYDYQARFYDSSLGRFVQADTIVPGLGDAQAWDRYAYVQNNPIRYTDPSGYYYCEDSSFCTNNKYHLYSSSQLLNKVFSDYEITLKGSGWSHAYQYNAALGITLAGRALAGNLNDSASAAFTSVYGEILFEWNTECYGCRSQAQNETCVSNFSSEGCLASGAITLSDHHIMFASMATNPRYGENHVVHELGHAISPALDGLPYNAMALALTNDPRLKRSDRNSNFGFAGAKFPWQQAVVNVDQYYEIWADQFLGWVFNAWDNDELGKARSDWMILNMAEFIK